ncbi:MAG: M12 family metallo-peptidase [Bacteroidota bacterium]
MKKIMLLLAFASLSTLMRAQTTLLLSQIESPLSHDYLDDHFDRYKIVALDLAAWGAATDVSDGKPLTVQLEGLSGKLDFSLQRWDFRAANYQRPGRSASPKGKSAQWIGRAKSGGRATFTIDPNFILGQWHANGETFHLEPLWRLQPDAARNLHVLYRTKDMVASEEERCLSVDLPSTVRGNVVEGAAAGARNKQVGMCLTVDLALASDFELFQQIGSVSTVENFMLGVLMNTQTDYDDAFDDELSFSVVATYIATSEATDPWSNTTLAADNDDPDAGILPDFADWGDAGNFGVDFDVASLWTGRDLDGTTVGVAYRSGLCSSGGRYNVLQNFTTSATFLRVLWSHELGHNFSAVHDVTTGFIMSPSVNSTSMWSPISINTVNNFYSGLSCLDVCPPEDPPTAAFLAPYQQVFEGSQIPFFDQSTGSIDDLEWSFPGGNPTSSTEQYPVVEYPNSGRYQAFLTVSNAFGATTSQVLINVTNDETTPKVFLFENFETGFGNLTVQNLDRGNTWGLGQPIGNLGLQAAFVNNYDNNVPGEPDRLQLPVQDLTMFVSPTLELEYAYRRFNANFKDQLIIRASTNGRDFQEVFIGDEDGSQNFATGPDEEARFFPESAADWCFEGPGCLSVDLSDYAGFGTVYLEIENRNGWGNLMWIDNVALLAQPIFVLPVEWLSFSAVANGKTAALSWEVVQDEAHLGFQVERSEDGAAWKDMDWVPARETIGEIAYTSVDPTVRSGQTYFYRLRQEDADGRFSYSAIREVRLAGEPSAAIFPNPAQESVWIQSSFARGQYELLDLKGAVLQRGQLQEGARQVSLFGVPAGVYLVRILAAAKNEVEVRRLVRQ